MTAKEIMQLALGALENGKRVRAYSGGTKYQPDLENVAITALRSWLEEPEAVTEINFGNIADEPCRSAYCECDSGKCTHPGFYDARDKPQPAAWVGLTPEDYDSMRPRVPYIVNDFTFADVAAIVEAKLKEKNK
jgi:hypothetical protein